MRGIILMKNLIKVISIVGLVVFGSSFAMEEGSESSAGNKRPRAQRKKRKVLTASGERQRAKRKEEEQKAIAAAVRRNFYNSWHNSHVRNIYFPVSRGDIEQVKLGLASEKNFDINKPLGPDQKTVLHNAALGGHTDIVKFLLEQGARADVPLADGTTALHMACEQGHLAIVVYLVQYGASIFARTSTGQMPRDFAAMCTATPNFLQYFDALFERI